MSIFDIFRRPASPAPDGAGRRAIEREQMLASLLVMAWIVEARDPYTGGHLWRVSRYASMVCERVGLPAADSARISIGGFLHDLGKVGIPDAILRKPDKLTDAEFATIKTHPELGARMLAGHPLSALVLDAVAMHHEMPNGRGYPRGLSETNIPQAARIVGVCDAFDAMTSARPYRPGMPIARALDIVESHLGSQFDTTFGQHLIALGKEGLLEHVVGHSDDGIPLQNCLNCGPTLVTRREHRAGDHVYCPSCSGAYRLEAAPRNAGLNAVPTGRMGSAAELELRPDTELIRRFVSETARRALPALPDVALRAA